MKIFVSNKFKKEEKKTLRRKLEKIISSLESAGHKTFNLFRDMNWKVKELPPGKAISLDIPSLPFLLSKSTKIASHFLMFYFL